MRDWRRRVTQSGSDAPTRLSCDVDCHRGQRGTVIGSIRVVVEADDAHITRHVRPLLGQPGDEAERHLVIRHDHRRGAATHRVDHVGSGRESRGRRPVTVPPKDGVGSAVPPRRRRSRGCGRTPRPSPPGLRAG